jgi:hypothetical protein
MQTEGAQETLEEQIAQAEAELRETQAEQRSTTALLVQADQDLSASQSQHAAVRSTSPANHSQSPNLPHLPPR